MNVHRLSGAFAALALAAFASDAAADGTTHAMGYLPPPKGGFKVQRVGSPKARTLLGATRQVLPERYDLREEGWVSPVKNQGDHGNCWSFAPCAALESHFLKTGRGEFDLSEKNIVNLSGWEPEDRLDGGFDTMAFAYMTRWTGPVAETNDVYAMTVDEWTSSRPFAPLAHVQNIVWIDALDGSAESRRCGMAVCR